MIASYLASVRPLMAVVSRAHSPTENVNYSFAPFVIAVFQHVQTESDAAFSVVLRTEGCETSIQPTITLFLGLFAEKPLLAHDCLQ
jgi:hypothetical protein